jgi:hypothetical protein
MGTKLTGSQLPRARHCAWPYREDVSFPERPRTQAADDGTEVHSMLEHWLAGEPVPAMGPRAQMIFEQVKLALGKPSGMPEPAFAIDLETGDARLIGIRLDRNYGDLKPSEIALTSDWCRVDDNLVEIGDLKTGHAAHVAHPRDNLQLLANAYAAAKWSGKTIALVRILIAREDESVPLFARMDGGWMDAVLAELREIHFRTQLPSPAVPGEHCSFCPALGACPQTAQLSLIEPGDAVRWTTQSLSAENDAKMVMHLPMLEKAVEAIRDSLKQRAPIQLPNGKVWRETKQKRTNAVKSELEKLPGYSACLRESEISVYRQVKE